MRQTEIVKLSLIDTATRKTIDVRKLPALVGRDPDADIRLEDADLPPFQCMIGQDDARGLVVWNLRPDFPVRVNGESAMKS